MGDGHAKVFLDRVFGQLAAKTSESDTGRQGQSCNMLPHAKFTNHLCFCFDNSGRKKAPDESNLQTNLSLLFLGSGPEGADDLCFHT